MTFLFGSLCTATAFYALFGKNTALGFFLLLGTVLVLPFVKDRKVSFP